MGEELKYDRRHFFSAAAMTLGATTLGISSTAKGSGNVSATSLLHINDELTSLVYANGWLNSQALTSEQLAGKVVLIHFWTYTCINWLRTLPYVRAWSKKYKDRGLVVIGVHTPEFEFEKNVDNVLEAAKSLKVDYPIAIDNDFEIWHAFKNEYWPALYLVDARGRIGHRQFGEGEYELSERTIQKFLAKVGSTGTEQERDSVKARHIEDAADLKNREGLIEKWATTGNNDIGLVSIDAQGVEAAPDWKSLQSPENYVGYERTAFFTSPGGLRPNAGHIYAAPGRMKFNHWALSGDWTAKPQAIILNRANGSINYRFHARDLHLVMGAQTVGKPVRFRVKIDDLPPGVAHGIDANEEGKGIVTQPRLYQLIRQQNPIKDRHFEIEFLDAGVEAFAFTFG